METCNVCGRWWSEGSKLECCKKNRTQTRAATFKEHAEAFPATKTIQVPAWTLDGAEEIFGTDRVTIPHPDPPTQNVGWIKSMNRMTPVWIEVPV